MTIQGFLETSMEMRGASYEELRRGGALGHPEAAGRDRDGGRSHAKAEFVLADGRLVMLILPAGRRVVPGRVGKLLDADLIIPLHVTDAVSMLADRRSQAARETDQRPLEMLMDASMLSPGPEDRARHGAGQHPSEVRGLAHPGQSGPGLLHRARSRGIPGHPILQLRKEPTGTGPRGPRCSRGSTAVTQASMPKQIKIRDAKISHEPGESLPGETASRALMRPGRDPVHERRHRRFSERVTRWFPMLRRRIDMLPKFERLPSRTCATRRGPRPGCMDRLRRRRRRAQAAHDAQAAAVRSGEGRYRHVEADG